MTQRVWCECHGCGDVEEFMIDGYAFGDRILEGVMFTIDKHGKARIQEEDADYFIGLDVDHWLKLAEEYAREADYVQCAKCRCDIELMDEDMHECVPIELIGPFEMDETITSLLEEEK